MTAPTAGPYERAVRDILDDAEGYWWPSDQRVLALGCPPWFVDRLANETGAELRPASGGAIITAIEDVVVVGSAHLDGPGTGTLVVQDLASGWSYDVPTRCHPDVAPHRWPQLTLALSTGLNPRAAADVAAIGWGQG
ncbi:MAG TPA: hypothetical protein VEJ44_06795 [Acidimicrobiales bacterium]|nr:hypothetical protein [Acidimicrobiales bacterium]